MDKSSHLTEHQIMNAKGTCRVRKVVDVLTGVPTGGVKARVLTNGGFYMSITEAESRVREWHRLVSEASVC